MRTNRTWSATTWWLWVLVGGVHPVSWLEGQFWGCSSILQCYLFHMYVGVRAGGGIGDEIEDPAGDEYELYRVVFDITFFFFVIVILLAIIQGKVLLLDFYYVAVNFQIAWYISDNECFLSDRFNHWCLRRAERPAGAGQRGHGGKGLAGNFS